MATLDLHPAKGMYRPGEPVRIHARVDELPRVQGRMRLSILHLSKVVAELESAIHLEDEACKATVEWQPPEIAGRGYGAEAVIETDRGEPLARASTAFDVLPSWTAFPRYGFLTEFHPGRQGIEATLDLLCRYHINGLQFYDWQRRHDDLVSPTEEYTDPLGRRLSLTTVRALVEAARARGMASMAYLAVYAASRSFWESHPSWSLRDSAGQPIPFGEQFLGLMDPSPDGPWARHLLAESVRALDSLGFDGLHIDQYGDPKVGYGADGQQIDLAKAYASFVDACKARRPEASVVFNAIDAWPLSELAQSRQDFAYLEIWPHRPRYQDLRAMLEQARREAHNDPMVVAQYIPAEREENIRLADALIAACGGTRIELGEDERLLTDPYFPDSSPAPAPLRAILRRHLDFVVRYGELIGPSAKEAPAPRVTGPSGAWVFPRSSPGWVICVLVNLAGLEEARWDEPHSAPRPLEGLRLEVTLPRPALGAWWASPDEPGLSMRPLACSMDAQCVRLELPALVHWGFVAMPMLEE